MAAIKNLVSRHGGEIQDGIAWVAVWKQGRSWAAESFYIEDGSYDDGYTFNDEDVLRMSEIIEIDHKAIMINGYYTNCGVYSDDGSATIADMVAGIEWNYYNRYNQLSGFYDGWVIK